MVVKEEEKNRTFPSLSLLFLSLLPLPDKISFQMLLRMNQADDPDEYLLLPKETLCLCEAINIKNQGHSACTQGRLWGFSHTWLGAQLCRLSHYGPECPAVGCFIIPGGEHTWEPAAGGFWVGQEDTAQARKVTRPWNLLAGREAE